MAGKGQLTATNIKPVYHIHWKLTFSLSRLFKYIFKIYHSNYHRNHTYYDIIIYKQTCKLYEKKRKKTHKKNEKLEILKHVVTKNYD